MGEQMMNDGWKDDRGDEWIGGRSMVDGWVHRQEGDIHS